MSLAKTDKVYVAGHRGLAGSAIVRALRAAGFENLALRSHAELELADAAAARSTISRTLCCSPVAIT